MSCLLFHDWYGGKTGVMTCGTYHQTGPLPGENVITGSGSYEDTIYRQERHCLDCGKLEYRCRLPDGRSLWIDITNYKIKDKKGLARVLDHRVEIITKFKKTL